MKNLFLLFSLSILLSGCFSAYPQYFSEYSGNTDKKLFTNIPIKPSGKKVEIIFPGEAPPTEPYIKVDVIEVQGGGTTKQLIEDLQYNAQIRGIDALMILSNNNITEYDEFNTYTSQKIAALGIKYIKNIDYLDECAHHLNVIKLNSKTNKYDTVAIIKTGWDGRLIEIEKGKEIYWHFLFDFSLEHLAYEKNSKWKFRTISKTRTSINTERIYTLKTLPYPVFKTIKLYEKDGQIESLKIIENPRHRYSADIKFTYDEDGYLTSQFIDSPFLGKFRQDFIYGKNDEPLRIDVFKIEKNDEENFYFKAVFERYEQADLEALLTKAK